MELTKQDVLGVIDLYIEAWTKQDPDLITTIFTEDGSYHERVLEEPIRNHEGIRKYWQTKVVESQANISCKVLNLYLDGNIAIVEWEAEFDDLKKRERKLMQEIAVLTFKGKLISGLREYWFAKPIGALPSS